MPDFAEASLADVFPSAAAALGCPGYRDVLGLGAPSAILCLLVDGLGHGALRRNDPPWMATGRIGSISSVLPTTTAVALASLGTGSLPGQHGMVAASFVLPETGDILSPLHWGREPVPEAVQVEPTISQTLIGQGIACHSVGPHAYAHSGLTRAALRGPLYHGARGAAEYIERVRMIQGLGFPSFTYVYWPELDRIGHARGVEDSDWVAGLDRVGHLVTGIRSVLRAETLLLVTSDHGMVTCPPGQRFLWDELRDLHSGVIRLSGEPRCRLAYLQAGLDPEDIARTWRDRLASDFDVWTRRQLCESGLMGEFQDFAVERLGDLIILATGDAMLSCPNVDPRISSLPGQHGAWTDEEAMVPFAIFHGN